MGIGRVPVDSCEHGLTIDGETLAVSVKIQLAYGRKGLNIIQLNEDYFNCSEYPNWLLVLDVWGQSCVPITGYLWYYGLYRTPLAPT